MTFPALLALSFALFVAWNWWRATHIRGLLRTINSRAVEIGRFIGANFFVQPCGRCHESQMLLIAPSPNGRSVHCRCTTCRKEYWVPATTTGAVRVGPMMTEQLRLMGLLGSYGKFAARVLGDQQRVSLVSVVAPNAPLPFEQTTREPIPEAIRSEVWRRDLGRCVKCGSNQNLEFDHVIPVAMGGATSVRNLQLLCRGCNREKGRAI